MPASRRFATLRGELSREFDDGAFLSERNGGVQMLRWRLLIGIPVVTALILLCWLDANAPAPGLVLMPFFLVCVFFLCKEVLYLLNAGGIYPRKTTIYTGVFGTIVLCWFSCYNSLPLIADLETTLAGAIQSELNEDQEKEAREERGEGNETALRALEAAKRMVRTAENALRSSRNGGARKKIEETSEKVTGAPLEESGNDDVFENNEYVENDVEFSDEDEPKTSLFDFSNEKEWKTAAFACVHILLAIAAGVLIAFVGEMLRFKLPGGHMINLSGAVFAIVYIGLLGSFMVMLRIAYGVAAVVSMIIVTKMCDVGAYSIGRLFGRHKMAPSLSPGKTIEGGLGGMLFAILGAWFSTAFLFPLATGEPSQTTWCGVVIYGLTVGFAGALGDLAESLVKRDAMRKDSGTHVPGFGGFLDIFDSLLLAAPVAFGLWAFHVIR